MLCSSAIAPMSAALEYTASKQGVLGMCMATTGICSTAKCAIKEAWHVVLLSNGTGCQLRLRALCLQHAGQWWQDKVVSSARICATAETMFGSYVACTGQR